MADDMRLLMEIAFNIIYLAFIWFIVILMSLKMKNVESGDLPLAQRFRLALLLLAIGDTGHVGFRVLAYLSGGLEANATLVGYGALSTAITITFFYMILVDVWRIVFQKERNLPYYLLMLVGLLRLGIMIFPQNQWDSLIPPFDWGLYRNIPLTILGLTIAFLILKDSFQTDNSNFKKIGYSIVVSYAFYIPVILLVQQIPIIGMLMIPKTMAYMMMAWFAYTFYFK